MNPTAILLVITVVLIVIVAVACIGSYLYTSEPAAAPVSTSAPWAIPAWCQYCEECRETGAMKFDGDGRYICSTCLCSEHLEAAPEFVHYDVGSTYRLANSLFVERDKLACD